jgi:hypothetical protein
MAVTVSCCECGREIAGRKLQHNDGWEIDFDEQGFEKWTCPDYPECFGGGES